MKLVVSVIRRFLCIFKATSYSSHFLMTYNSVLISPLTSTEQLLELHRGQGKDIYWRDSYICPTEDEYMMMVKQSKFDEVLSYATSCDLKSMPIL